VTNKHKKWKGPDARTVKRAGLLLGRAHLQLQPGVPQEQPVAMLARVLDRHDPSTSEHGRLLIAALRAPSLTERRAGPRSRAEQVVRALLAAGQAPTPQAVAAELGRARQAAVLAARAWQARLARVAPLVERDGPCVVKIVAGHWRRQGASPTIWDVARALRWPRADTRAILVGMVEAGWVTADRPDFCSLRPGPRARQHTAAAVR